MDAKKLKILMTTDTVGGVWNYSLELCRALIPHNLEIHLLGLGAMPDENQVKEVNKISNVIFYPSKLKLEWMENPWVDIEKTEKKIDALCKIIQPDLFHFNNYINKISERNIPKVTVYHSCVQTWWQAVKGCSVPQEWDDYVEHVGNSCNSSDVLIFPTNAIRKAAYKENQLHSEYKVISNAREMVFTGDAEKEKIILCTGRIWDEAKNLMLLCELADKLPWPIFVAGENADPNTSQKVTLNKVRFLGKLNSEELRYWLERTAIYINLALYEPFGLAVLEAAKAGCALALSNLETLKEVWQENALYFDPRKGEAIVETLLKLIEDNALRKDYQQKAKRQSSQYNGKAMGDSYYHLYESLLNKSRKNTGNVSKPNGKHLSILTTK